MKSDYKWLHEWELILKGKYILELGCGDGKDSKVLFELGRKLVACDRNLDNFKDFSSKSYNFKKLEIDHSEVLPFVEAEFDVVVASLCLHHKRFFEKIDILNLFNPEWKVSEIIHKEIDRYNFSKYVWQFSARKTRRELN